MIAMLVKAIGTGARRASFMEIVMSKANDDRAYWLAKAVAKGDRPTFNTLVTEQGARPSESLWASSRAMFSRTKVAT